MAVKAAAEQGAAAGARYLRALREGLMCFRRKLDTPRRWWRRRARRAWTWRASASLGSNAIVEAFGADLEETRAGPHEAAQLRAERASGRVQPRGVGGAVPRCGEAAAGGGRRARRRAAPDALAALRRFGRMAAVEVAAVCDLPGPRARPSCGAWRRNGG